MPMPKVNQVHQDSDSVSSDDVISVSVAGSLDQLEVQEVTAPSSTTTQSVLPTNMSLNDPGGVLALRFLESAGQTAFERVNEPKALVAIPTADLVSHGSFKTGSKFVIRVVPSADSTSKNQRQQEESSKNQELFFDRASLQTTSEVHEERYQIFEGFDAETLFMFGTRPKVWTYQFIVENGARPTIPAVLQGEQNAAAREQFMRRWNMDFVDELIRRYERYYRGTRLVQMKARCFMSYEDVLIESTVVGMSVSRNTQIPAAANVSITFVVHEFSLLGPPLNFGQDATLAQLLASTDQKLLMTQQLRPSSIIPSKKTPDQLAFEAADAHAAAADAGLLVDGAKTEQEQVKALAEQSARDVAALDAQADAVNSQLANTSDPAEQAALRQVAASIATQRDQAVAQQQDAEMALETLGDATDEAEASFTTATAQEDVQDSKAKNSSSGDVSTGSAVQVWYVDFLTTSENGTRSLVTYKLTDEISAAALQAGGASAESLGATLVERRDVTDDVGLAEQSDGSTIRNENDHGS